MPPLPRLALAAALLGLVALPASGCGRQERAKGGEPGDMQTQPAIGVKGDEKKAASDLGFPGFATKNTTRVGGADAVADAAGVARAVYPSQSRATRPPAVVLVDARDWRAGIAASVLAGTPVRGAILFSDGRNLPPATSDALGALRPTGAPLARAIDAFQAAARNRTSDRVIVVSADDPAYAMPAAAWAAKAGDPVLFVQRDRLPAETAAALKAHQQPRIYLVGPPSVVSAKVEDALRRLGTVTRVGGGSPIQRAIDFSRFTDGHFGWGVVDPGHGLVFARSDRPLDAAAAAPLSAHGTYGPLLLLSTPFKLDGSLEQYL